MRFYRKDYRASDHHSNVIPTPSSLDYSKFGARWFPPPPQGSAPTHACLWRAGQRIFDHLVEGAEKVVILHLGDHDPSGIDMTRDIHDQLFTFVGSHLAAELPGKKCNLLQFRDRVEARRIALNRDQISEYDPPPNPAKITDSRSSSYIEHHGDSSWELDALPPTSSIP